MVGGVAHGGKRRRVGHPHRPHQRHLAHTVSTAAIGRPHHGAVMQCMLRMCRAYAASKPTKSLYTSGLEATKYDGTAVPLASLAGKVSIVVNVASR